MAKLLNEKWQSPQRLPSLNVSVAAGGESLCGTRYHYPWTHQGRARKRREHKKRCSNKNHRFTVERHIWALLWIGEHTVPCCMEERDVAISAQRSLNAFGNTLVQVLAAFTASTSIFTPRGAKAFACDPAVKPAILR